MIYNQDNTQSITLESGRILSFRDTGSPSGRPIVFFHGSGSSNDGMDLAECLLTHGGRLISAARPGMGESTPSPGRTLSGFASDVAALTDQLRIKEFSVLGISGGAPYAAAVAHALPDRVASVALLSCGGPFAIDGAFNGMARPNRVIWSLAHRRPRVLRFLLSQQANQVRKNPDRLTERLVRSLRGPDKTAIEALRPEARVQFFATPMAEALHHGPDAMVEDMQILRRPWDFPPAEIQVPTAIWHGTNDTSAPIAMGRWLAEEIPGCSGHFVEGGGHLSVILNSVDRAVTWLLSD